MKILIINRWAVSAVLFTAVSLPSMSYATSVSAQGTWETTLLGRDMDGNAATFEAYYDTALDITWLADANAAGTTMNWVDANAWAAGLDINGVTGWRLPDTVDTGSSGCDYSITGGTDCGYNVDTSTSEMASMYYDTLGNLAYYDTSGDVQAGWGLTNTGPFSNFFSNHYWSATEFEFETLSAWYFFSDDGYQAYNNKTDNYYVWAVHSGDVGIAVVPVPAAVWLFGSGLLGLIGTVRRKKAV